MAVVFISYSRKDKDFVGQLGDALTARGRKPWLDWKDIPLTAEWLQEILRNIDAANDFLFVISPDSVASPNCRREIEYAAANHKRMVPLFYRPVADDAIPESLNKFQRIDFSAGGFDTKLPALVEALDADLEWKQAHTRLLTRAKEWESEGKDKSFLLRGKDLIEAEQWTAKSAELEPKPTTLQSQYLLASRQFATKTQRLVIGATTLALLIAVGLAIYAFRQKSVAQANAMVALSREVSASAILQLPLDPELSLLLAIEAARIAPTAQAEDALRQSLAESHVRVVLPIGLVKSDEDAFTATLGPDSKEVVTASVGGVIRVWDVATRKSIRSLTCPGRTSSANFSPDGRFLQVFGEGEAPGCLWDARNWKPFSPHAIGVASFRNETSNPNSRWVVRGGKLIEAATGKAMFEYTDLLDGAFNSFGQFLVLVQHDEEVDVEDILQDGSSRKVAELKGHTRMILSAKFSPDGLWVVTASNDGTARVWDTAVWEEEAMLVGHTGPVVSAEFSADGANVVTASIDGTARVWDAGNGGGVKRRVGDLPPQGGKWMNYDKPTMSPDGRYLVEVPKPSDSVSNMFSPIVLVKNTQTHQMSAELRGHTHKVHGAAFSPDSRWVATVSEDNTARVWEAATGKSIAVLHGHSTEVTSAAFSPDERFIVTTSEDGTVRVWHVATEKGVVILRGADARSAVFSGDGRFIITRGAGGKTQAYTCEVCGTTEDLLALATRRVTRQLTSDERRKFLHRL